MTMVGSRCICELTISVCVVKLGSKTHPSELLGATHKSWSNLQKMVWPQVSSFEWNNIVAVTSPWLLGPAIPIWPTGLISIRWKHLLKIAKPFISSNPIKGFCTKKKKSNQGQLTICGLQITLGIAQLLQLLLVLYSWQEWRSLKTTAFSISHVLRGPCRVLAAHNKKKKQDCKTGFQSLKKVLQLHQHA